MKLSQNLQLPTFSIFQTINCIPGICIPEHEKLCIPDSLRNLVLNFAILTNEVAIFQNPVVHENSSQHVYLTLNWVIFSIEWKTSASKMSWLKMTRVSLICDKEESSLVLFSESVAFGG